MKQIPFSHHTSNNCETGVMHNLLKNKGVVLSENLIFGIGSGLFFIYLPFLKHPQHGPITSFRYSPGAIIKKASKSLGLPLEVRTFANAGAATQGLNEKLDASELVGITGDIYYFDVTPEFSQIHFFGHNIIVYGYDDEEQYLVSDPIITNPIKVHRSKMEQARFGKGMENPKGKMYWFRDEVSEMSLDLEKGIRTGIQTTISRMLNPLPFFGVKGIRKLGKNISNYPVKKDDKFARTHINSIIRQIEFLGSGGSGYRNQFFNFLQEASEIMKNKALSDIAAHGKEEIVKGWRMMSLEMVRCFRVNVKEAKEEYQSLGNNLQLMAAKEEQIFRELKKINL